MARSFWSRRVTPIGGRVSRRGAFVFVHREDHVVFDPVADTPKGKEELAGAAERWFDRLKYD